MGANQSERVAHALVQQLALGGVEARVSGRGVHWQVDVGPRGSRSLRVHCFWYERAVSGLVLGMNPANARSRLGDAHRPVEGPEYLVILKREDAEVADGRAHSSREVVACASAWLRGADLDAVVRATPFIQAERRLVLALAERLEPALERELKGDPGYELWVYGADRSCQARVADDGLSSSFLLGQAQVAHGRAVGDLPAAISRWLVAGVPLRDLASAHPGIALERHAEILEEDPARWHWLHLLDRVADEHDVLAPLRSLIELLAARPVATTFYSFSSLNRLCFSASSHYPWVCTGLPVVVRSADGGYQVGTTRCDLPGAVELVESRLAASPVRPFFGSAPHHELPLLDECLVRNGSPLRGRLAQRAGWYDLRVEARSGPRRCTVDGHRVTFEDLRDRLRASWPTLADAAGAIHRFCEDGASLSQLAADPKAANQLRG